MQPRYQAPNPNVMPPAALPMVTVNENAVPPPTAPTIPYAAPTVALPQVAPVEQVIRPQGAVEQLVFELPSAMPSAPEVLPPGTPTFRQYLISHGEKVIADAQIKHAEEMKEFEKKLHKKKKKKVCARIELVLGIVFSILAVGIFVGGLVCLVDLMSDDPMLSYEAGVIVGIVLVLLSVVLLIPAMAFIGLAAGPLCCPTTAYPPTAPLTELSDQHQSMIRTAVGFVNGKTVREIEVGITQSRPQYSQFIGRQSWDYLKATGLDEYQYRFGLGVRVSGSKVLPPAQSPVFGTSATPLNVVPIQEVVPAVSRPQLTVVTQPAAANVAYRLPGSASPVTIPEKEVWQGSELLRGEILFDFRPNTDREVSVIAGETVTVLENSGAWCYFQKESGVEGYVPSNFVQREG